LFVSRSETNKIGVLKNILRLCKKYSAAVGGGRIFFKNAEQHFHQDTSKDFTGGMG
jgi:hypothetical protein